MMGEPIYQGGLLRCCVESILLYEKPGTEGTVIGCRYHADKDKPQAKFTQGAWHWVGLDER